MSSLLSDKAAHLMIGETIGSAFSLVTGMALVRILPKEQIGQWQVLMQLNVVFSAIFVLGLPPSLMYFVPRARKEERGAIVSQTMILLFVLGTLAAIVLAISAPAIAAAYSQPALSSLLPLFALFVLFEISVSYTRRLFILYDRSLLTAVLIIVDSLGLLICLFVPASLGWGLGTGVIWLAVFSCGRLVITTFLALDCVRGASLRPSFNFLKRQIGYSLPLGMSWAVPVIASRIDKIILPLYVTPANFAVYAMGAREIPLTGMITTSISTVIWPRISALHRDGDKEGLLRLWRSAVVRSSFLIFPIMALLMAVSEKLFVLLYTDKYGDGLWPFRLYLLLVPLQGAMQGVVLSAMGRTRMVLWISILRTIFTVGVSILFIQWFGILGAPVAVLLTAYLSKVAMTWRVKRELNASVGDIFPWWQLLRILGVAAIAGVAAWAASTILPGRMISCLLGGVVMLAVYVPLVFLFRLPDEKDKELIAYNWKRLRNLFRAGKEKGDAFGNESTGGDGDNGRV